MQIAEALGQLDRFMYTAGNKDKVFAVAQFLPMAFAGPAAKLGLPKLGEALAHISQMADTTRAVGRLTLLAGALSADKLKAAPTATVPQIAQHVCHILFCIFENTAVYAGHGVLSRSLSRLGGCAVTCWFYVLLIDICMSVHALAVRKVGGDERQETKVRLVKDLFYIIFSLSCLPPGGPKLLSTPGGPLEALHLIINHFAPPHIPMDNTIRGLLGFGATVCEFYYADRVA